MKDKELLLKVSLAPHPWSPGKTMMHITEQKYRGGDFSDTGSIFVSTRGVRLRSDASPRAYDLRNFYVRGPDHSQDNIPLTFIDESILRSALNAMREYNGCESIGDFVTSKEVELVEVY